ncbi:TonB-dependent receptor [Parapedobacter sp. DT-150]|uniref:TonB-dependent receptor n=1 Tax=Parapedobacter sp. DT-150 TaxID=3396162 RepID=UPI003F1CE9BE
MIKYVVVLVGFFYSTAQGQTGNIRGRIVDNASDLPITGATIKVVGDSTFSAQSDNHGSYRLNGVPLGRHALIVAHLGYLSTTIFNVDVVAGKEAVADTKLTESYNSLDEVVITMGAGKDRPLNKMAIVSARQVAVEEITRYSGGRSDVARLASNFSGVSTPDDSRNDIVVRGNSPSALLWRIEGIPVPSPNHFSTLGTTGSPVSALNANVMANSDFLTSAFPAEYGNALGGVFDIGFRKGNTDDFEYTVSLGALTGIEAMAEGPLGKKGGSFLAAGRYGFVGLIGAGGTTNATPNYRDIAFNLDFGGTAWGKFSVFGIGGTSDIDFLGSEIDESDLFAAPDENTLVTSRFGVLGVKNILEINGHASVRTILAGTISGNTVRGERIFHYGSPNDTTLEYVYEDNSETRFIFSSLYNSKISSRLSYAVGALYELYGLDASHSTRFRQEDADSDGYPDFVQLRDSDEGFSVFQPYIQGQYRLSEKFTLNAGLHGQYFSLNNELVAEPRASLSWNIRNGQSINIGYGLHHQNVPPPILLLSEDINGIRLQTNRQLDLVRSRHYVLGYDIRLGQDWRVKLETYYQDIDRAAVEARPSSYSTLTEGADFGFSIDKTGLVSVGTGNNSGIEFTLEKFFSKGYYGLLTASVFEAKYIASDGVERDSPFNNGYVVNALGGREFRLGKQGRNSLFFDTRLSTAGGRRYTPVDLEASSAAGFEVLRDDLAFSAQYSPYFRVDFKFGINVNSKKRKLSHRFYLDLQNITNNNNVFVNRYNRLSNNVDQINQIGFFPDFGYRMQF